MLFVRWGCRLSAQSVELASSNLNAMQVISHRIAWWSCLTAISPAWPTCKTWPRHTLAANGCSLSPAPRNGTGQCLQPADSMSLIGSILEPRRNRSSRELDRRLWRAFSWTTWIVPMRKPWNHWPHVLMHSLIQSCSMGCLMQSSVDQRTWRCLGGRNSSIASAFPTTASTPTCSSATAKQRSKRSVSPSTPLASPPSKN